ncbi:MAG: cupin domain-containing protein [Nitrospira sp.]|nr:cupin domain-containing protein [Nitrospira sp.]MBH0197610.1 cupin domain-containing protein [Nitrospira sp.]
MRLFVRGLVAIVILFALVGPFLDRVVFPEPDPGPEFIPQVGQVFHSASEGFTQRIVRREHGLIWSELIMEPHASGPPPHVHVSFSERFRVEQGTVSVRRGEEVIQLHPGDELLITPGVIHKPFNQTNQIAVVSSPLTPEYALPERFGIFLSQAYGFFDARPENSHPPRALLQMSRFSPVYDSWLGEPPVAVQQALYWFIGPIARLLGYRAYYSEYAPARVAGEPACCPTSR